MYLIRTSGKSIVQRRKGESYHESCVVPTVRHHGSINGSVYFKGIPTYNPVTKSIYLENFDYDLDTRNLLLRTANWMFQGVFAKNMQQALTFNIAGQVDEMKKQVQANLNKTVSKGVAMSGNLTDLSPDKVYMTPNSIIAVINASGKLNVKVDGL